MRNSAHGKGHEEGGSAYAKAGSRLREVAEYLGIPNISNVLSIDDVLDEKVFLTANLDDKIIRCSIALPCLISMDGDINTPRLPSYRIKKALKENTVNFLTFTDFQDQDPAHYGLTGA